MFAAYQQDLNPLNNVILSTFFAALPVLVIYFVRGATGA